MTWSFYLLYSLNVLRFLSRGLFKKFSSEKNGIQIFDPSHKHSTSNLSFRSNNFSNLVIAENSYVHIICVIRNILQFH